MAKIYCPLNEAARMSPNQAGIISKDGALLFTETEQCVVASADLLGRMGVEKGEHVGILLEHGWESVILLWALIRMGAVVCPLYASGAQEALSGLLTDLNIRRVIARKDPGVHGVSWLNVSELTGFTAPFKKEYRPVLDLNAPAVVQFAVDEEGAPVYLRRTVGSCYYSAQAGNAVLPLRSNQRWLLKPFYSWQGIDTLFRCWMAGAGAVALNTLIPSYDEINKYEITHVTVSRQQEMDELLTELTNGENELTHALVEYVPSQSDYKRFKEVGLFVSVQLGTPICGYFATVDRAGQRTPFRYVELKQEKDNLLMVQNKHLRLSRIATGEISPYLGEADWVTTGLKAQDSGFKVQSQ